MAATSLWYIKGRLKGLIDYVENPEKTVPSEDMQDFFDMFSYVKNPFKTNEGEYFSTIKGRFRRYLLFFSYKLFKFCKVITIKVAFQV